PLMATAIKETAISDLMRIRRIPWRMTPISSFKQTVARQAVQRLPSAERPEPNFRKVSLAGAEHRRISFVVAPGRRFDSRENLRNRSLIRLRNVAALAYARDHVCKRRACCTASDRLCRIHPLGVRADYWACNCRS